MCANMVFTSDWPKRSRHFSGIFGISVKVQQRVTKLDGAEDESKTILLYFNRLGRLLNCEKL